MVSTELLLDSHRGSQLSYWVILETSDLAEGSQLYRTWRILILLKDHPRVILTCKDYEPYHYRVQNTTEDHKLKKQQKHYRSCSNHYRVPNTTEGLLKLYMLPILLKLTYNYNTTTGSQILLKDQKNILYATKTYWSCYNTFCPAVVHQSCCCAGRGSRLYYWITKWSCPAIWLYPNSQMGGPWMVHILLKDHPRVILTSVRITIYTTTRSKMLLKDRKQQITFATITLPKLLYTTTGSHTLLMDQIHSICNQKLLKLLHYTSLQGPKCYWRTKNHILHN